MNTCSSGRKHSEKTKDSSTTRMLMADKDGQICFAPHHGDQEVGDHRGRCLGLSGNTASAERVQTEMRATAALAQPVTLCAEIRVNRRDFVSSRRIWNVVRVLGKAASRLQMSAQSSQSVYPFGNISACRPPRLLAR